MDDTFLDEAQFVLEQDISEIWTVEEWAAKLELSREHFSRQIKKATGCTAYHLLTETKLDHLEEQVRGNPEIKAIEMAYAIGLTGIRSLYQYLKRHRNCSIREFKQEVTNHIVKILVPGGIKK